VTDGQDDHLGYLGDLEHLDHLECLGSAILGPPLLKMIKVLNILTAGSLSILPISVRSARKKSCARPASGPADVM
jgi:hypothetical protein